MDALTAATPPRPRARLAPWWRGALAALMLAFAAGLVFLTPRITGTRWQDAAHVLHGVRAGWLAALTAVWFAGLLAHLVVLTCSLPGLSPRRAFTLKLAGSAVGNSLPLGGPLSLALTTGMTRSWRFRPAAVTTYLLVTHLWNLWWRILFGSAAVIWFLTAGPGLTGGLPVLVTVCATLAALLALAVAATNDGLLGRFGRATGAVMTAVTSVWRSETRERCDFTAACVDVRDRTTAVLRTSWRRMSLGMIAYFALLVTLLDLCLRASGHPVPVALTIGAVGVEQLVTTLPITPGAAGTAELALIGCLTVGGVPAADALAATLLFRFFTYVAEIPLGLAVIVVWRAHRALATGWSERPAWPVPRPQWPRWNTVSESSTTP